MSQVDPVFDREPLALDTRRMTPARRARIIAAHDGHCAYPGCEETEGLEVDHIIALALGGKDTDEWMEPLCGLHHAIKTKNDLRLIAKAKRRKMKASGTFPKAKQAIRSRGFSRRFEDGR